MGDLNEQIELNLKLLAESKKNEIFLQKFLDNKGKEYHFTSDGKKFALEMEQRKLIRIDNELCIITEFGFNVFTKGGWLKHLELEKIQIELQEAKSRHEFEKSKIDLELAKNMLDEYPYTKWCARIGLAIALCLGILEFIKYINN
jgi:hypothetical protein